MQMHIQTTNGMKYFNFYAITTKTLTRSMWESVWSKLSWFLHGSVPNASFFGVTIYVNLFVYYSKSYTHIKNTPGGILCIMSDRSLEREKG